MNRLSKHEIVVDRWDYEQDQEFIGKVYEIAFGDDAINRDFSHEEVLAELKEAFETAYICQTSHKEYNR